MRIAIIGGIGSGKSEVLKVAREMGITCVSADEINSELLQSPDYIAQIQEAFPSCVKDGVVDRKALARIIFSDDDKRKLLNSIAHPRIMQKIAECNTSPLVCELPLFIEGGDRTFDEVVLVKTSLAKRIKRLENRGFSTKDALKRIRTQVSDRTLKKYATIVITNNGTIEDLQKKAHEVLGDIIAK